MEKRINTRIINKHETEENWLKSSLIPLQGEIIVYDIDANHAYERIKIGDGKTSVNTLPFVDAGTISGASLSTALNSSDSEIPTSKAVSDAIIDLSGSVSSNYDESIIGLSVDGQVITYIKGDGSVHTIVTQDTDTTYSLGTDEVTGLTKLYATTGSAEDGTMTQKAIKTELDKKVGVSIDNTQKMLIFTI